MKKVDNIYQNVKNPHFVKNLGESAGFFKKTHKNPPGRAFSKFSRVLRTLWNGHSFASGAQQKKCERVFVAKSRFRAVNWFLAHKV